MTALGLAVAVPAVLAYNWLMRRNKAIVEELAKFANDLHGYMVSGGAVKPQVVVAGPGTGGAARSHDDHGDSERHHRHRQRHRPQCGPKKV
jgi:biopolymer transport protein ExbB